MMIYLSGKIPKGNELAVLQDWRADYAEVLGELPSVEFLSPEDSSLDESNPRAVFGHDCHLIKNCDLVIINASVKLGAGTAQEMLIAKYFRKPVVTVLPPNTHHRQTNLEFRAGTVKEWIHPFIYSTSDVVVDNLEQARDWLASYIRSPDEQPVAGLEVIEQAIEIYHTSKD